MSALKGKIFEDYVANNLSRLFPDLNFVSQHEQVAGRGFDIHAKDSKGVDYFIEVKNSECNRLNIGQIVEYKAELAKKIPEAKIILICKNVDASIKELVKKIGVDIWTFSDLGILESKIADVEEKKEILKLSPIEQKAYFALLKRGSIMARTEDLSSVLGVSAAWAKNILSKLARKGVAQRVGRGKYVVIPADILYGRKSYVADPLVLISELMKETEYYVAYYSAAHVHGLIEQMPFKTTVAVLNQMRSINVGNVFLNFVNLKKSRFFGYEEIRYLDATINVSDIEKTLVDGVDRPELCGGIPEVARIISNAFETGQVHQQKLVSYVKKFGSQAIAQRLGFIIEYVQEKQKIPVEPEILEELLHLIGSKIYLLDTKSLKKGEISKKWKINNNAGYLEIYSRGRGG
jgi:predicted transcriptional regulator of viral defense system